MKIALVGVHGYGLHHLFELQPLIQTGRCNLVAVADPQSPEGFSRDFVGDTPHYTSLEALLEEHTPEVVILATPLHTHKALATTALRAGAHVLLEKPPTVTLAEFTELVEVTREAGRACQVGFQSLGSSAYGEIDHLIADGEIGQVTGIGVVGTWVRPVTYYQRSPWAGRRTFEGRPVVDGVVTNPLAHSIATALRIEGSRRSQDISDVDIDLYRAHDIEADDTSSVVVTTTGGTQIAAGLTLCASQPSDPRVIVHGTKGSITFYYTTDQMDVTTQAGTRRIECSRVTLLDNLMDHVADPEVPLLSSLEDAGGFMRVLEAVRTAPDPVHIDDQHVQWLDDEQGNHPVVQDVEDWCEKVAAELKSFTALGAPWTR